MYIEANLFTASILILVFAILIILTHSRRTPERPKGFFKKERRTYPRYQTSLRIKYKTPIEEGISWIKDVSRSGARLFLNNALKTVAIGQPLELEISLPSDTQPILVKGNIVWAQDTDAGFHFVEAMDGDIDKIIKYVNPEEDQAKQA
ncbi:MAG: PilZ domain-containing protein [Candidatus Omnitrophota bacterium]